MKGTSHAWCSSVGRTAQAQNPMILTHISEVRIRLFLQIEKYKMMHQSKSIQTAKLVCLQKYFKKKTTSVIKIFCRNISCFPVLSRCLRCLKRNAFYLKTHTGQQAFPLFQFAWFCLGFYWQFPHSMWTKSK